MQNPTLDLKKHQDQEDDGYSSSQSDDSFSQEEHEPVPIDITKYLPPANPLIPKIFQEDYEVRTAINVQFNSLPNFNKNKNFQFVEPSERPLKLQEYIAQQQATKEFNSPRAKEDIGEVSILKKEENQIGSSIADRQQSQVGIQQVSQQKIGSNLIKATIESNSQESINNIPTSNNTNTALNIPTSVSIPANQIQSEKFPNKNQQSSKEYALRGSTIQPHEQIKDVSSPQIQSPTIISNTQQIASQITQSVSAAAAVNTSITLGNQLTSQNQQQSSSQNGVQQPQQSQNNINVKLKTLLDYHRTNRDNLIYKKYNDYDLNEPTRIGDVIYFATYIANLKTLIKLRNKKDSSVGFDQNKASFNRKVSIKEIQNYHHRFNNSSSVPSSLQGGDGSGEQKTNITLSSNFESGNLFCAYRVNDTEFDLILQNDINTKGNTQWFFFSVSNAKAGQVLKFNILNLVKPGSLFNEGLCPVIFSVKQNELNGSEWVRDGFNIKYYKGDIQRDGNKGKPHYVLTFSYYVHQSQDTIYFAHSFPYTFTDLKEYINTFMKDDLKNKRVSIKKLCKTIAGNNCEQLTITSSSMIKRFQRKGIVIFARQHPGETGGSYMMQGCIDFLLGDSPEAEYLRESCVFKIVPMLNPDGVIHGNYRCSLAGCDLNRRWKKPRKKLHPTVYYMKEMIKNFNREREIKLIIDLHGHSRKMNTFFYGCSYKEDPVLTRVFPYMMSKLTDYINFEECRFNVQKSKEKTARIALWKELRVSNVFTVEASFYGKLKNQQKTHYSIQDYLDIGGNLVMNLYNYLWEEETEENKNSRKQNSLHLNRNNILKEMKENEQKIINMESKSDSDGSDSDPSEDELPDEQIIKLLPKSVLTKKQKKLMELEEEKAKEKREKELAAKRLQKKNELLQGNQSDSQTERKRFTITKFVPRTQKQIEKKQPEVKTENQQVEMVDVAVQTDASFIMEMKAYFMKKQSLQNGLQSAYSVNNSLMKSQSMGGRALNKFPQQYPMDQIQNRQVVPNLMNNPQAKKENQLMVQSLSQNSQLVRNSLQYSLSPNSQINAQFFDKPNGSQTLRLQNDVKYSQSNLKLREINTSKQDEVSLKDKLNFNAINPKNEGSESTRFFNAQSNNVNSNQAYLGNQLNLGQREQMQSQIVNKPKTPLNINRPQSIEGGALLNPNNKKYNPVKSLLTSSISNVLTNIIPNTTTNANNINYTNNNNNPNLPFLINSNTSNVKLSQPASVSSPKTDNIMMKKSKSSANQIIRTGKLLISNNSNLNNNNNQIQEFQINKKQKQIN